jgi:hypothetical protein
VNVVSANLTTLSASVRSVNPDMAASGVDELWARDAELVDVTLGRRTNHRRRGTISRYRVTTADGLEREVIHGQTASSRRRKSRVGTSVPLTIGTAPPLSLGPEGLVMHFLLKTMESGLDGVVFGPERSRRDIGEVEEVRALASKVSFARTAHVSHLVCDRLAAITPADLQHMLWTGVSLGAMKGIAFAAHAPSRGRRMVYSHFVVPAAPYAQAAPTERDLRRFNRGELGAMMRLSSELLVHDIQRRMFSINGNVVRAMRPGLTMRYARSMPSDSVSNIFTAAWRDAVISGDAGVAATGLPSDHLATFELFDRDDAGPVGEWRRRLDGKLGDSIRIVVKRGRHTDALRIPHQSDRANRIGRVLRQLDDGVPVDELTHPYA